MYKTAQKGLLVLKYPEIKKKIKDFKNQFLIINNFDKY